MIQNNKISDEILAIELQNDQNENTNLKAEIEKHSELKGIALFIYPKANTPGCTEQAKLFKEKHNEFVQNKYAVYGLSADNADSQAY
ncbi:hypothetical protein YYC_05901 [Plasmodium yoelii 17X]|uniref:Alkyl hydroperoxide reductase subunit C/ Thiol specific antioxidant domain-containing protein n=1 Tax=Plasmodium yoelii 17X TaxID=1323249 RepID=V7P9K5_PLAYE|nr:hypothetical protein YYC_05901 [Plasmodium yoelii 17X]